MTDGKTEDRRFVTIRARGWTEAGSRLVCVSQKLCALLSSLPPPDEGEGWGPGPRGAEAVRAACDDLKADAPGLGSE